MNVKFHEAFALDSAQDRFWWMDHFLGDQLQDEWRVVSTGSTVVVDQQTGGIVRLTTGAVGNNTEYIDWANIRSLHVDQRVSMESRIKLNQTTLMNVRSSLRFDASNRIYFYYDTTISVNWLIRTTDGGALTSQDSGVAVDTDYHIFRIECFPTGEVHFYIDGTETANSPITTNIPDDATDFFQPELWIQTRTNATKSMDVDYCAVRQDR